VTSKSPQSTNPTLTDGETVAVMRRPRVLAALLISATVLLGSVAVAVVLTRAAAIEAEARAEVVSELYDVTADLSRVNDRAIAARSMEAEAQECIDAEAARLQPALVSSARFSTPTVALASALAGRASEPRIPGTIVASDELLVSPVPLEADADRADLEAALVQTREIRADAGSSAHRAQLAAAERHAACAAAHDAVAAVIAEVGPRTDAVISASGMATPETVAELRAARDAVLAVEGDGTGADALTRWLVAASAVESAHAVTNAAAIATAERAAAEAAARESGSSTGGSRTTFDNSPAPLAHPDWRVLTPEEVAALGMPPGTVIQEVPSGYYPDPLLPLG
jgi:hypothetical protein